MDYRTKERLVRQLHSRAAHFAWQLPIRPTDQPDFLQECLWQALRKGDDFLEALLNQPDSSRRLYWFLRSVAGHFCRSQNTLRLHEISWSALAPQDACKAEAHRTEGNSLEGILLRIDLEFVLQSLPNDQLTLFIRRHVYGEDFARLARDLHTTEHAIRERLSYIGKKLAVDLKSRGWLSHSEPEEMEGKQF